MLVINGKLLVFTNISVVFYFIVFIVFIFLYFIINLPYHFEWSAETFEVMHSVTSVCVVW